MTTNTTTPKVIGANKMHTCASGVRISENMLTKRAAMLVASSDANMSIDDAKKTILNTLKKSIDK
jgi:hypothetical protein